MKKLLLISIVVVSVVAVGAWYALSGAGGFIKEQIEQQGSQYLGTQVSVFKVDLVLSDGKLTINDLDVENPNGFSSEDAFSLGAMTLDLGDITDEPYTVENVNINSPEVLYELDASGNANLLVLKDNMMANLPTSEAPPKSESTASPLVIIEQVTVENVRLKVNFENLKMGDLDLSTKAYEVTLPTFEAGSIGKPNGIPADQAGGAIANAMLDNIIAAAKAEVKKLAKAKAKEKLDAEKDKLVDKASEKLKDLFND